MLIILIIIHYQNKRKNKKYECMSDISTVIPHPFNVQKNCTYFVHMFYYCDFILKSFSKLLTVKRSTCAYLERDGFHVRQLNESLQLISCCNVHWLKFMISGASYIRINPSALQVANKRPRVFGANFTSVTEVRESTRFVLLTQCLLPRAPDPEPWPTVEKKERHEE